MHHGLRCSYHTLCSTLEHFEQRRPNDRLSRRRVIAELPIPWYDEDGSLRPLTMLDGPLFAIRAARPLMTPLPRAIVEAVFLSEGSIGSAQAVSRALGMPNRFALGRLLRREGVPPLHRLAEWATVLSWVAAAERDGESLCAMAFRSGRHPSACYRLVKEVTGLRWEEVRSRGARWVQCQLLREFGYATGP